MWNSFTHILGELFPWKCFETGILKSISWMNKWRRRSEAICLTLTLGNPNQPANVLSLNSWEFCYSSSTLELSVSTYGENSSSVIFNVLRSLGPRHLSPNSSIIISFLCINMILFGVVKHSWEGEHVKSCYKSLAFSDSLKWRLFPIKHIWCPMRGRGLTERIFPSMARDTGNRSGGGCWAAWRNGKGKTPEGAIFTLLVFTVPVVSGTTVKVLLRQMDRGSDLFSRFLHSYCLFVLPYDQSCVSSQSCLDTCHPEC